jgi:hypothetical protein
MAQDTTADKVSSLVHSCDELRAYVLDAAHNGLPFHDFETGLWDRVLRLGHTAVEQFLRLQGTGDLGPTLDLPDGRHLRRLEDLHQGDLTSVFGTFSFARTCYGTRAGQKIDFVPLDNRLQLPQDKPSYLLQEFNALLGTEGPFGHVAKVLQRILQLEQHVHSLERQGQHMAEHVEPYRDAQPMPAVEEEPILVRSADAKGVPMRTAADAPPIKSHDHKRGPKTGRKKQAIVGAVYTVAVCLRTAEDIVEALFRQPAAAKPEAGQAKPKRPAPCNKRVMARLNEYTDKKGIKHDGMAEVYAWMQEQLDERNPVGDKVIVNLFDGDERLWDSLDAAPEKGDMDVLDLLHVTGRLWTVAALFATRDTLECQQQVREWLLLVLKGKVAEALVAMRNKGEQAKLKGTKKKELELACGYLEKRQDQMRYHECLKKGYPIASGVIEGACRHYVKDRMERTGMSWKQPGAQAMLELRAQALNGDWDEFQDFYRLHQAQQLYPHRQLLETVSWPMAA